MPPAEAAFLCTCSKDEESDTDDDVPEDADDEVKEKGVLAFSCSRIPPPSGGPEQVDPILESLGAAAAAEEGASLLILLLMRASAPAAEEASTIEVDAENNVGHNAGEQGAEAPRGPPR